MVFWDSQPVEAPKEKGPLPAIAATLQSTVSRVMAEQGVGAGAVSIARSKADAAAVTRP